MQVSLAGLPSILLYNEDRTLLEHWLKAEVPKDVWNMLMKWLGDDHKMYVVANWRMDGALVFDYRLNQEFDW